MARESSAEARMMRHPRSFPQEGELFRYEKLSAQRKTRVAFGQRLYEINETQSPRGAPPGCLSESASSPPTVGRASRATLDDAPPSPSMGRGSLGESQRMIRSVLRKKKALCKKNVSLSDQFTHQFNQLSNTRLYFGAKVALQTLVSNEFCVVKNSSDSKVDGKIISCPLDQLQVQDYKTFKLLEMTDPGSCRGVYFGDHVWLQIVGGPGEPSWKNGSVIGAKVHEATGLPTVPLDPMSEYRHEESETPAAAGPRKLGQPTPTRAILPKGKEDAIWSFHEMRIRNISAVTIGRWKLMPASEEVAAAAKRRAPGAEAALPGRGGPVCNLDQVYLEQDFFYMCHDATGEPFTFHKIPEEEASALGYKVDRRGVFVVHVAEASANLREMSKGEQRSEMLMNKARKSPHS